MRETIIFYLIPNRTSTGAPCIKLSEPFKHKFKDIFRRMNSVLTVKTQLKPISSHSKNKCPTNASVKSSCARPPRGLLRGICPPCQSRGWGICKFCTARGPGICQPRGHSRAFDTYAVSYQNITTQKVLLEKTQIIAHLSRTGIN